jgi:flagellar hook-associated protein 2
MTRPSNSVTDAVDNVTFTLRKTGSVSISVAPDAAAVRTELDNVVKAYNSAVSVLKNLTSYDAATRTGSVLLGEATVRNLQSQMRLIINGVYGNETDSRPTLSSLGLTLQSDGALSINSSRYTAALSAAPEEAERVINGASKAMADMLDKALDTEGQLAARTNGIQSSIRQISEQKARIEVRMSAMEARYRAQFSALESLVSTMTSTNNYLSSQFQSLRNNN